MIGKDFDKIELNIWGLHFLEPNALFGDFLLFSMALFFAHRIKQLHSQHPFYLNWRRFYLLFGLSFMAGGLGHFLFAYWGLWGKYPSWILSMIATYYMSLAQISLWPNQRQQGQFKTAVALLVFLGILVEIYVFNSVDLSTDQSRGLAVPSIVSGIGMVFSLFFLGLKYQKSIHRQFNYFWIAVLLLFPSAIIQSQKINLAPWFDRNDFSHLLLVVCMVLYWKGIQAYQLSKS